MGVTAGALQVLHRIHQQLSDLRERLDRGPKQIRAREGSVESLQSELAKSQHGSQQARMSVDKKQLDLRSFEGRVRDWKARLNACSSNKEYQALLDQIAADEMAGSVLSDEILEGLEKIDELESKVGQAKAQVAKAQEELAKSRDQVARSSESIRADIARLEAELLAVEATLPAEFRIDYERVVRARGANALAQVDDCYCGGCNQQITANMENNLALGQAVFCLACGRLLYLAEGRGSRP
jgi:predicted  nucleic acid-binding Zn-ribbon protein